MPPLTRPNMSLLSVVANLQRHSLASDEPFLLLMDLAWPGDAPQAQQQHVRFVRDLNPLQFDAADGLGSQEYLPYSFSIGDLKTGSNGEVPEAELLVSNVLFALQTVLDEYSGGVGAALNLYVVNTANPGGESELALSFTVKSSSVDAQHVHLKLGASSPLRRLFPIHVYRPNYCIWQYNSPVLQAAARDAAAAGTPLKDPAGLQCGYQGFLLVCDHTIDGPNGCRVHNNVVRFGGFPGIDTNGAAVASVI